MSPFDVLLPALLAGLGGVPSGGAPSGGAEPSRAPVAMPASVASAGSAANTARVATVALEPAAPEELGARWGTEAREREYWRLVRVPTPEGLVLEAGAFAMLDDGRVAVGTRHGDIVLLDGVDDSPPEPTHTVFASGLDEIFGLQPVDGGFLVTQSCELTRVTDSRGDGRADRFDALSNGWGYENYHEYAFGSEPDPLGNVYVALGLSYSYYYRALFRGWVVQVTPGGETIPYASGLRSPAGIGHDANGQLFYIESQGPWNSSCSLKALRKDTFHGHPVSHAGYEFAPGLGDAPAEPNSGGRLVDEAARIPELVPYAVVFPYIRMGRSITDFAVDTTGGAFGPFEGQLFLGDFSLSVVLRATTEQVNGVWQGACYPFREGLSTGLLDVAFTPEGRLLAGGTNRGWPVRGTEPFALERLEWTGKTPFEMERVTITPDGFRIAFTREVDQTEPAIVDIEVERDGRAVVLTLDEVRRGHVHELDLDVPAANGEALLHRHAFYTVNEIPND